MNAASKLALGGLAGLTAWLGVQGTCLALTENAPPSSAVAAADAGANPYSAITERNVFHLNPPPPPPEPAKPPPPPLPTVILSGFVRKGDQWKVLLAVRLQNPDPHEPELTFYLDLAEGDKKTVSSGKKDVEVQLVKAHADQETADIINAGTPVTLSMKDNGFQSPASAPGGRGGATVIIHSTPALPTPPPPRLGVIPDPDGVSDGGKDSGAGGMPVRGVPPNGVTNPNPPGNPSKIILGGAGGAPR